MKLSDYLAREGLTRRKLAIRAGVAHTTVMRLLDRGIIPQQATAQKLSGATDGDVSVDDITTEALAARSQKAAEAA